MSQKRLVSGIQPTGKMHLGNYLGAVSNWVHLQDEYDSYFLVVDLHSLTTVYEDPKRLRQDKLDLAIDILAAGVDPAKCALFHQSDVPEHSELHLYLSMITPLQWLMRVPTYKGKIEEIKGKDLDTYGFLGYPVLMAADILLYKAQVVPVGQDQLPHLELAREIARRFNSLYKKPVFPMIEEKLTQYPVLPGLDGRKMSKSYQNTIPVSATPDEMQKLVMSMLTDPNRKRRTDPGNPYICPVFAYHKIYNSPTRQEEVSVGCQTAEIGCVDCKKECASLLIDSLGSFRARRAELMKDTSQVSAILTKGAEKARNITTQTIREVKQQIGL